MSGECEGHQGRHVNKLMARKTRQQIDGKEDTSINWWQGRHVNKLVARKTRQQIGGNVDTSTNWWQGRHVNKFMARKTRQQIGGNTALIRKKVCSLYKLLVFSDKINFLILKKNKKIGLSEEAPKAQYRSLWQWDIACDEKALLRPFVIPT